MWWIRPSPPCPPLCGCTVDFDRFPLHLPQGWGHSLPFIRAGSPGHVHGVETNQNRQEDGGVVHAVVHLACHKGSLMVGGEEGHDERGYSSVAQGPGASESPRMLVRNAYSQARVRSTGSAFEGESPRPVFLTSSPKEIFRMVKCKNYWTKLYDP